MTHSPARTFLAAMMVALFFGAMPAAQKPADLFQQALAKERVAGKLDEAIVMYERVVKDAGQDRALAARALLQIAGCQERSGNTVQAKQTYTRVAADYSDQAEAAAAARAHLAPPKVEKADTSITVRKAEMRPSDVPPGAAVAPNGKFVALEVSNGLAVRDLATGVTRTLAPGSDDERRCSEFNWSFDSTTIAYTWCYRPAPGQPQSSELRVVGRDGQGGRVVHPKVRGTIEALAWTPDGREIIAILQSPDARQLMSVSVIDGSTRVLGRYDGDRLGWCPDRPAVSPDGHYFVQGLPGESNPNPNPANLNCDLYITPLDGGAEQPLIQHPAQDRFVAWTPDGDLLFLSDRTGTWDLWRAHIVDGHVDGLPGLVRREVGNLDSLGMMSDGALYLRQRISTTTDVYVAALDPKSGRVTSGLHAVAQGNFGNNHNPAWSPDGRWLAWKSGLPKAVPSAPGDKLPALFPFITLASLDTGEVRQVRPRMDGGIRHLFKWAPDSRALIIGGATNPNGPADKGAFKTDAMTGETTTIVAKSTGTAVQFPQLTPDGKSMVFAVNWNVIVVRDMQTGDERKIFDVSPNGSLTSLSLSPDGTRVAFRNRVQGGFGPRDLMVVSLADAKATTVIRVDGWIQGNGIPDETMAWSHDGRHLVYGYLTGPKKEWELWRSPVDGGPAERLGLVLPLDTALAGISMSPDGRYLALAIEDRQPGKSFVLEGVFRR